MSMTGAVLLAGASLLDWQATATVTAALVAGLAVVLAAVVGASTAAKRRDQVFREQWWQRAQWATERALSADRHETAVGLAVLHWLGRAAGIHPEDDDVALTLSDLLGDPPRQTNRRRRHR